MDQKWSNNDQFGIKKFRVIGEVNECIFLVRCITNSHNFSNVDSTMRVFLVHLV